MSFIYQKLEVFLRNFLSSILVRRLGYFFSYMIIFQEMTVTGMVQKLEFGAFCAIARWVLCLLRLYLKDAWIQGIWICVIVFSDGICSISAMLETLQQDSIFKMWSLNHPVNESAGTYKKYRFNTVIDLTAQGMGPYYLSLFIKQFIHCYTEV